MKKFNEEKKRERKLFKKTRRWVCEELKSIKVKIPRSDISKITKICQKEQVLALSTKKAREKFLERYSKECISISGTGDYYVDNPWIGEITYKNIVLICL